MEKISETTTSSLRSDSATGDQRAPLTCRLDGPVPADLTVDPDDVWAAFVSHNWGHVQNHRDLILTEIERVLRGVCEEKINAR